METSVAAVTVSDVLPVTVPESAETTAVPASTVVAKPPGAMLATAAFDDVQVALAVRFCVELSV